MDKSGRWCVSLGCFLFLSFEFWLLTAQGRDLYVPKEYSQIQQAVQAARAGDRIMVAEGIYLEQVRLKPGLTLEGGWNKDYSRRDVERYVTVIDAKGKKGWVVLAADTIILDGFTIRNGSLFKTEQEEYGSGIYCLSAKKVIIRNNIFFQNEPSGIYAGDSEVTIRKNQIMESLKAGIHLDKGSVALIESNIIKYNKDAGISSKSEIACQIESRWNKIFQNGRSGIDCQNASGKIYNNIIFENHDAGIRARIVPLEIINNTLVRNTQSGLVVDDGSNEAIVKNNILAFNGESGIMSAQRGYSYNLLFANADSEDCDPGCLPCVRVQHAGYEDEESILKIGHIIANPQFVDLTQDDYHLIPGSPAIDAGDPDPLYHDKHFPPSFGTERNDLGAYGGPFTLPEDRGKNNRAPQPHPKASSPVYTGDLVRLEATQSLEPDGDSMDYQWILLSSPPGSKAKLYKPENPKASFRADGPGEYRVALKLTDRWGAEAEAALVIEVQKNHPPQAYAGEDLDEVSAGDRIQLFGDVSTDDDQDPLTYRWQLIARPARSLTSLSEITSPSPSFLIDQPGSYIVQLIVNDGKVDSQPDEILINTVHQAPDKIRHVPDEYPTIQSAVDAAQPGDTILVQSGVYHENIYIDKPLNLKGINWPVIDGGSQPSNVDTVKIAYLGDRAGRVEGFVITGGGAGPLGHGLSAWDSAPTICHNQFVKNPNNGVGLHGRQLLTEKAEIYENLVYENKGGIGNGRGSSGHIHHNYVFRNRVFGIGCRGFSSPRIEHNYIFENHMGIGMREVSSPQVVGNYIYRNRSGIRLSPVSTVKASVGEDMSIHNNLIFQNQEDGIKITSFNLSRISIINNTIDANNEKNKGRQNGGLVLGWPWPGEFEAVVYNNIITNNGGIGLLNYTGVEGLEKPGVKLKLAHNNVWNNKENYQGCGPGEGDFSHDPLFVSGGIEPWESYFLSQAEAGQPENSPCLDSGFENMAKAPFPSDLTTRKDLQTDRGGMDLGFHYQPDDCKQKWPLWVQEVLQALEPLP